MMAAYQPQPGGMHPGMAPHGHPGQPMNPAQLQQMGHPGVSGPQAPHVTQAGAMMGMQPGANGMGAPGGMGGQHPGGMQAGMSGQSMAGGAPNVHAMNHMTPQMQQQMMAQQSKWPCFIPPGPKSLSSGAIGSGGAWIRCGRE